MDILRMLGLRTRRQHRRRDRWSRDGRTLTVSCAVCRQKLMSCLVLGTSEQRLAERAADAAWALHERGMD